jgi:hypothetical protein
VDRGADSTPFAVQLGAGAYRGLLRLYPQMFWRSYHDELEGDFEEASLDALETGGRAGLTRCWARIAADLPKSLAREWLRTPWLPVLAVSAMVATFGLFFTVGRVHQPLRLYRRLVAARSAAPQDSPELLTLMLAMALIPIVGIVLVSAVQLFANVRRKKPPHRA